MHRPVRLGRTPEGGRHREAIACPAHPGRDTRGRSLLEYEQQHRPVNRAVALDAGVDRAGDFARDVARGQPERFLIG
jgi:hypothetical protein